jgi:2-isopropylmalate synthase
VLYSVNAISGNTESQGEVTVRLTKGGRIVNGVGADPDIIVASAKAYLAALNKLHSVDKVNPQTGT